MKDDFARPFRVALFLAAVGVCAVSLYCIEPTACRLAPRCPFHVLTGLHCPGCGTLRAMHHLLHGDWLGACDRNVLAVIALPGVLLYLARDYGLVRWPTGVQSPRAWPAWSIVATIAVYTMLRNVPLYPFSVLAP